MQRRFRHTAVLLLATYLCAGILLEVTHRDHHNIPLQPRHVLAHHDCGAHERHVPLDKIHDCLACAHSTQRVTAGVVHHRLPDPSFIRLAGIPVVSDQLLQTDILYSGKRGPPSLL